MGTERVAAKGNGLPPLGVQTGVLTEADLPPVGTKRWVMSRKAQVVAGVRAGLITLEEACRRYNLSMEEFLNWQALIERHGVRALRVTRLQDYRQTETNGAPARPRAMAMNGRMGG